MSERGREERRGDTTTAAADEHRQSNQFSVLRHTRASRRQAALIQHSQQSVSPKYQGIEQRLGRRERRKEREKYRSEGSTLLS